MKHNALEGILAIEFPNTNEDQVKVLRVNNEKVLLILHDGETKEIYFKHPVIKRYSSGSRQTKKQLRLKSKSEIIYAKKDFLKDLSNFHFFAFTTTRVTSSFWGAVPRNSFTAFIMAFKIFCGEN